MSVSTNIFILIAALPLCLCACDLPGSETCDRVAIDALSTTDDYVSLDVHAGDMTTTAVSGALTITGSLSSVVRIEQLRVGSALAKGLSPNFQSWSVELSQAQLHQARVGEFSTLEVVATDVCGVEHTAPELLVRVDAPTGTPATGLTIEVAPSDDGECYVPADGSATAVVSLHADSAAAGVRVKLESAIAGTFVGVDAAGVQLLSGADQSSAPPIQFRAAGAGKLGILASAGGVFDFDSSGLEAVAAPTFAGAAGAVPVDTPLLVRARTDGRLGRCWASASSPTLITVAGEGVDDLLVEDATFDQPGCSQQATFDVTFDAAAPAGTRLEVWCADSYEQTSSVVLEVQE